MISQFIEQVQVLMEIQQIKLAEAEHSFEKSKYNWLCSRKITVIILSIKHEYKIRQALTKVTVDQQIQILRKLMKWLNENPDTVVIRIPEVTLHLINNTIMVDLVRQENFSRMNSFRNSLRRLSVFSNKIFPAPISEGKARSVTFKEQPVIYRIS